MVRASEQTIVPSQEAHQKEPEDDQTAGQARKEPMQANELLLVLCDPTGAVAVRC